VSMPIKAKCHLEDLGREQYHKAIERLLAGVLAATVAKDISKEFPGVPIPLLAQRLTRSRLIGASVSPYPLDPSVRPENAPQP
jgi:hypothetical protein